MPQDRNDKKNVSGAQFTQPAEEFQVRSATSSIQYCFKDPPPPPGLYVGVDDLLEISVASLNVGQILNVNVRILEQSGRILPLSFTAAATVTRTFTVSRFQLAEGILLSVNVSSQSAQGSFQWQYASIALVRPPFGNTGRFHTLCAGYVNQNIGMCWPQSVPQRPTDGSGIIRPQSIGNPAAGADFVITVPSGSRWRILSLRATLVTAVAAANRLVTLTADTGGAVYMASPSGFTHAASITNNYCWFDGAPNLPVPFNLQTLAPLPCNFFPGITDNIRSQTTAIQAADQWSNITFDIMEWFDNQ